MSISMGELVEIQDMETKDLQVILDEGVQEGYEGEDLEDLLSAISLELEDREQKETN